MEFSYRLTEAEYIRASKLGRKVSSQSVFKIVMFWVFIFVCLTLLWAVVQKSRQHAADFDQQPAMEAQDDEPKNHPQLMPALLENVGPFILLGGVWIFIIFYSVPTRLRRIYRKDPFMQGQFTVNITPESISTQNTAGTSSQTGWNVYKDWREKNGVVVLVFQSGACFGMSLAGLSEPQREELRGILGVALPKKRRTTFSPPAKNC
ncbi:hypothetical protein P8935_03765 [Telmatobacter sp. DSM 110680]|uniref:YcxB-like protein domain-containing protein n=1 Tax=Telmatobacter sp. DSM 110680 TaxID=3036704 RepID=A0AAU7DK18_9BACT